MCVLIIKSYDCVSMYHSVCLSVCLSVCMYHSVCVCMSVCLVSVATPLSLATSIRPCFSTLSPLCFCLSVCMYHSVCVSSVHGHNSITGALRSSEYFQSLPPLSAECLDLDGNASTLPIIFEDSYAEQVVTSLDPANNHSAGISRGIIRPHCST